QVIENVGDSGRYWKMLVIPTAWKSFVGAFGYMDIFLPLEMYKLVGYMFLPLLLGSTWSFITVGPRRPVGLILLVLCSLYIVAFIALNASIYQAQGRFIYP